MFHWFTGHVIAVHANTTQPENEEVLSKLVNKTISEEPKDDPSSEEKILAPINGYNICPVGTKPEQSILFFLYCKTVDDVITFTELFISGELQSMIEVIMNRLLLKIDPENTEKLQARLSLDEAEILALEKYSGIAGEHLPLISSAITIPYFTYDNTMLNENCLKITPAFNLYYHAMNFISQGMCFFLKVLVNC